MPNHEYDNSFCRHIIYQSFRDLLLSKIIHCHIERADFIPNFYETIGEIQSRAIERIIKGFLHSADPATFTEQYLKGLGHQHLLLFEKVSDIQPLTFKNLADNCSEFYFLESLARKERFFPTRKEFKNANDLQMRHGDRVMQLEFYLNVLLSAYEEARYPVTDTLVERVQYPNKEYGTPLFYYGNPFFETTERIYSTLLRGIKESDKNVLKELYSYDNSVTQYEYPSSKLIEQLEFTSSYLYEILGS